jgi:hypothetical protein
MTRFTLKCNTKGFNVFSELRDELPINEIGDSKFASHHCISLVIGIGSFKWNDLVWRKEGFGTKEIYKCFA